MKRLYRHAQIASEESSQLQTADILVEGQRIIGLAPSITGVTDYVEIDCSGRVVLPSLFDLHVHAREPGQEQKENIASCSEAAIHGGITGMVLMPNTSPSIDNGGLVTTVLESAHRCRLADGIYTSGAITKGRKGESLAAIASMKKAGCVMLTDSDAPVVNPQVLRRAMEYARNFDIPIATHGEVVELSAKGCIHEGKISYALGLPGIPSISEEIGIARDVRLAEFTETRLHVQHVTTKEGIGTVARAKDRKIRVTCEVTPHHLLLNHEVITSYDTNYKVYPPLRAPEDCAALLEALKKGTVDVIVSDHSPHTHFEKNQDFCSAPFGIVGLETALPSLFDRLIRPGLLDWQTLVRTYSANPRRILRLPPVPIREGGVAEFIVFHPERETGVSRATLKSRSANTPFLNHSFMGRVERVIYRGEELLIQ